MYYYYTNIIITIIDSFTVITIISIIIIVGESSHRGKKGENCGHFKLKDTVHYKVSWIFMRYISRENKRYEKYSTTITNKKFVKPLLTIFSWCS